MSGSDRPQAVFDAFGMLVAYPVASFDRRFDEALEAFEADAPELAERLVPMAQLLARSNPDEIEELYTRTFDLNPSCALETGYHLYGEDYDRGAFLVYLRGLMRSVGVEESGELPDHLSHVMRLMGRLDLETAEAISRSQVLPALRKILAAFTDTGNPYHHVVQGASDLLVKHFGPADEVHASAFACPAPYELDAGNVCPGMSSPFPE